jgi:hypothetical protein
MCRNWQEGEEVTVAYPNGTTRNGTIVTLPAPGRSGFCVLFFPEPGSTTAEEADPNVRESWLTRPGMFMDASASHTEEAA